MLMLFSSSHSKWSLIIFCYLRQTSNLDNLYVSIYISLGSYSPDDWIDFSLAEKGNSEELLKILSVIVAVSCLEVSYAYTCIPYIVLLTKLPYLYLVNI